MKGERGDWFFDGREVVVEGGVEERLSLIIPGYYFAFG